MHGSKLCRLCPDGAFEAHARAAPPGAHRTTRGCGLLWASAAGKKRRKPAGLGDASTQIEAIRATAAEATRGTVVMSSKLPFYGLSSVFKFGIV